MRTCRVVCLSALVLAGCGETSTTVGLGGRPAADGGGQADVGQPQHDLEPSQDLSSPTDSAAGRADAAASDGSALDAARVADGGAPLDATHPPADGAGQHDSGDLAGPLTDAGLPPGCERPQGPYEPDPWGGDLRVARAATGFFRTELLCGRWWFITPAGHPFYSVGVNAAGPRGEASQVDGRRPYEESVQGLYPDLASWAETSAGRLRSWGINTAGAWSDAGLLGPHMAYTPILYLAGADWQQGTLADYFDPAWEEGVRAGAARAAGWADDPNLLGYFLDNELRWGADWRGGETLLQVYLALPEDAPGKAEAVDLLLGELGDIDGLNETLGTALPDRAAALAATEGWHALGWDARGLPAELVSRFVGHAAQRYFSVTTAAVRAADPNHLILGNREVSVMTRREVYLAAAPHVDVLSVNSYVFVDGVAAAALILSGAEDPGDGFAAVHAATGLPLLISEFGFRAADAGLANSWPPIYPTLATQADRADAFEAYARHHQGLPWVLGYHWFAWVDQPLDGRFDGEDNNWGLVGLDDTPYALLTETMQRVNGELWQTLLRPAIP